MTSLSTRWGKQFNPDSPLSEYPRPQFRRPQWLCLNGRYDYTVLPAHESAPGRFDGEIIVPYCIESSLSGVGRPLLPGQALWYRRKFTTGAAFEGKRTLLHFGAVDWKCEVFVNGRTAGEHRGGYCPFYFDITGLIKPGGENELLVRAEDSTDAGCQPRGKQVLKTHGFWYTATSGIWQTVWLEAVDECHLARLRLTPDIDRQTVDVTAETSTEGCRLFAKVSDGDHTVFSGEIGSHASISIPSPKYWSPEAPFLYDVVLEVKVGERVTDWVESYFGMRKFSVGRDGRGIPRLMLNNQPYFFKGLLDQGYWPDGLLTPACDEAMLYDIQTAKSLGFNMLRKHIKVEPLRWYYHCDKTGMIVWQDMPSGGPYIGNLKAGVLPLLGIRLKDTDHKRFGREDERGRENFEQELFEMLETLGSSVCVGCWVPFNEGWGQFDALRIAGAMKEYDPGRPVDHASGWYDQGGPDLKSIHRYILPVKKPRPDARPFVLSEYGGYSMKVNGHIWNWQKAFGYRMFKTQAALTQAYRKLHDKQIIPLLDEGLSAAVYTQLSDVENEVNGLLTYDREILKIDADTVRDINVRLTID
ncbi:MAG TPA: glycoside hydrolase family 2 [Clostridiales bacterium]|nr:glycoside hydrolase family 2 [Clostridiales bacterium]HQK73653.1 glycoside hydrolase family 2 [Clostridiales bacterium]